jgi:hypothetical protein
MSSNNFASSRIVAVGAAPETTAGTAVFPTSAQMIKVVGFPESNQERPLENSDERVNSRDILAQFQGQRNAASYSVSMYQRPPQTASTESVVGIPQGDVFLTSFFGKVLTASGIQLNGALDDTTTTVVFDSLVGEIPRRGVIKIEDEFIYYSGVTYTDATKVAGSLTGCTRGFYDSTAAAHVDDTAISIWSRTYAQKVNRDSITLWNRKDFFYQMITGCTINSMSVSITNSGGQQIDMSGEGFLQSSVGEHTTNAIAANGATTYTTDNATRINEGMYIQNTTLSDNNGGSGYLVTDVDETGGTITIIPGIVAATGWASGDTITGFLPTPTDIGEPIENRNNVVRIDDVTFPIISTTLTMSEPTTYPTDEVNGEDNPTGYYEGQREYNMDLSFYFKPSSVDLYQDAFNSVERSIEIVAGSGIGNTIVYDLPRVKFSAPTVSENGDTVNMSISTTVLGTEGEDSMQLRIE